MSLFVRVLMYLRILCSDQINSSNGHVSCSDKTDYIKKSVKCRTYVEYLDKDATSIHSMFYDTYCSLSKQATGSHLRSDLLVHSNTDQHTTSQNMSTLQYIRLRTVSHQTAYRLAEEETWQF
jgi:hypothetical protein